MGEILTPHDELEQPGEQPGEQPAEAEPTQEPEPGGPPDGEEEAADADEQEGEPPAEPEAAAAQEPPPAEPDPLQLAFAREQDRHRKAIDRIVGENVDLEVCRACEGVGYLPPGEEEPPTFLESPTSERCSDCDGYGRVQSGSRLADYELLPCPTCGGQGHRNRGYITPPIADDRAVAAGEAWRGDLTLAR